MDGRTDRRTDRPTHIRTDASEITRPSLYTRSSPLSDANYQQESKVQFVYDAVYALVYALAAMRQKYCSPSSGHGSFGGGDGRGGVGDGGVAKSDGGDDGGITGGLCDAMLRRLSSDDLYQHILNVSFTGEHFYLRCVLASLLEGLSVYERRIFKENSTFFIYSLSIACSGMPGRSLFRSFFFFINDFL